MPQNFRMLRVISCSLFTYSGNYADLETEFYLDHGITFNEFSSSFILNKSPYVINWGNLNAKWDFSILDMHKFSVKVLIAKNIDAENARTYLHGYYY